MTMLLTGNFFKFPNFHTLHNRGVLMHCFLFLFIQISLLTVCAKTSVSYQTYHFLQRNSALIFYISISPCLFVSRCLGFLLHCSLYSFFYHILFVFFFNAFLYISTVLVVLCLCAVFVIGTYVVKPIPIELD